MHYTHLHPNITLQHRSRTARPWLRALIIVTVLQCLGMGLWSSRPLHAQEPSQDTITAVTLFETQFDSPPPGPVTLSLATITLAPGQATLPLEGHGSLLILVESGSVALLTDHDIDGFLPVDSSDSASEPGIIYRLRAGQRVTISNIGTIQFRGEGDKPSTLLLFTLVPEGGPSLLTMLVRN